MQWHYKILGEEFGPVSEEAIRGLISEGTLGPTDEVRQVGQAGWQPASSLGGGDGESEASDADLDAMLAGPGQAAPAATANTEQVNPPEIDLDAMLAPSSSIAERKVKANEWYYRIGGQRHGPFDFDTLFEHAAEGRFSRFDEILAPGEDTWVEAQSMVGLFPETGADLEELLQDVATHPAAPDVAEPRQAKTLYYYRVLNQEMGPVDLEALFDLVTEGNLRPDDDIRREGDSSWQRADSFAGLFPETVDESPHANLLADDGQDEEDGEDPEWFLLIEGDEVGPVTFGKLTRLAANGKIDPADQIRLTKLGAWMEAGSMVGLFPEPAEPEAADESATKAAPSAVPDRPVGDDDDWAAAILNEPAPEVEQSPPAADEPSPATQPTPSAEPTPVSAGANMPVAPRSTYVPPPAPRPQPKRSRPSVSMPSLSLPSGLLDALLSPPMLIGTGVVVLAVAAFFVPWGSLVSGESADLIQELDGIWAQVKGLYESGAEESEWASVATQVDPQLQQIATTAKDRGAGPSSPGLQVAYILASDHLPKALKEKQEMSEVRVKTIDNFMQRGRELSK